MWLAYSQRSQADQPSVWRAIRLMKIINVDLPLWRSHGYVYHSSWEEMKKDVKKRLKVDDLDEFALGAACYFDVDNFQPWVIWLGPEALTPEIVHEAMHITCGVLRTRGLKLTDESEEAYTYTITAIMEQILTGLLKKGRKK